MEQQPINNKLFWHEAIADLREGKLDADWVMELQEKAEDWCTCACGVNSHHIPTVGRLKQLGICPDQIAHAAENGPGDVQLINLGVDFSSAWSEVDMNDDGFSVKERLRISDKLAKILCAIEERVPVVEQQYAHLFEPVKGGSDD